MPLPGSKLVHDDWAANPRLYDRLATIRRTDDGQNQWLDPATTTTPIYEDIPCAVAAGTGSGSHRSGEARTEDGEVVTLSLVVSTDRHLPDCAIGDLVTVDGDTTTYRAVIVEHGRRRTTRLSLQRVH